MSEALTVICMDGSLFCFHCTVHQCNVGHIQDSFVFSVNIIINACIPELKNVKVIEVICQFLNVNTILP